MKELNKHAFSRNKITVLMLLFAAAAMIGMHSLFIVKAAGDGNFFLLNEDEVIYYCSGKLFSETNSIRAESCIDENVSRIGKMNWYGPGYNIAYGTLFKIVGPVKAAFPWFHFTLAMGMLTMILFYPIKLEFRLMLLVALAATQQFCVYIFTFFPETLVLFLACILTMLLLFLYKANENRSKLIYLILFVVCTLVFCMFRITFIFWLAALIGLAENRKARITASIIFIVGIIFSLIFLKFFLAPPFADTMFKIDLLFKGQLLDFVAQSWRAFRGSWKSVYADRPIVVTLLIGFVFTAFVGFIFTKNRLILGSLLVSSCLLLVLFTYYNVHEFYFVKQTAMLIPLLLAGLLAGTESLALGAAILMGIAIGFVPAFKKTNEAIQLGRHGYTHYKENQNFEKSLSEMVQFIEDKPTIILWDYREYDYGYAAQALLPFSTPKRHPVMYTTNIIDPAETSPDVRFQLHNRLQVDYILSRNAVPWTNVKLIHKTEFYHLYQLLNQP